MTKYSDLPYDLQTIIMHYMEDIEYTENTLNIKNQMEKTIQHLIEYDTSQPFASFVFRKILQSIIVEAVLELFGVLYTMKQTKIVQSMASFASEISLFGDLVEVFLTDVFSVFGISNRGGSATAR